MGGSCLPVRPRLSLFAAVLFALATWTCPASAGVAVTPARLEVDVGADGATAEVLLLNREEREVVVRAYVGLGGQRLDGSPIYFDDAKARSSASEWVHLERERFSLNPGDTARLKLRFLPLPGETAAYPVLFVEIDSARRSDLAGDVLAVPRIAVPILATFGPTKGLHRVEPEVVAITAQAIPGTQDLLLRAAVRNAGNVHGWIQGRIVVRRGEVSVSGKGGVSGEGSESGEASKSGEESEPRVLTLPGLRVLPGSVRTFEATWRGGGAPHGGPVRLRFEAYAETTANRSGATLTFAPPPAGAEASIAWVEALATPRSNGFVVAGEWSIRPEGGVKTEVELFDESGELLIRTKTEGAADGRFHIEVPYEAVHEVAGIAVHRVAIDPAEEEARRGFAATTLNAAAQASDEAKRRG